MSSTKPKDFPRPQFRDMTILGLDLEDTCTSHPEQYNVWINDKQVGYLRLRHGYFRADVPDCGGITVYDSRGMQGDGCFEEHERDYYLQEAIRAIIQHLNCMDAK